MCWLFHKWSQWFEPEHKTFIDEYGYDYGRYIQWRKCLICNKQEYRKI
jgi:hypothetical protein